MSRKIYIYNEKEYYSTYAVRQAIWEHDRIAFPEEPEAEEERGAFWASYGVTIQEILDPVPSLTEVQQRKLSELDSAFESVQRDCGFMSSVGFMVNGDSDANRNVDMLIRYFPVGVETVAFCGYDNQMHDVTKEQLETIMQEIVVNGQYLYQQKWAYRDEINACKTQADVEAIEIVFECRDFS